MNTKSDKTKTCNTHHVPLRQMTYTKATLRVPVCNDVDFRRNRMEHTGEPGCEDHQELDQELDLGR